MTFSGGKIATAQASVSAAMDRRGCIYGSKGFIEIENINNPERILVFDRNYRQIASYDPPAQITGYEYEVEACVRAIESGALECPENAAPGDDQDHGDHGSDPAILEI